MCDNKGETITFIENEFGYLFGGRTMKSWNSNN
jgi:hypothetical protein